MNFSKTIGSSALLLASCASLPLAAQQTEDASSARCDIRTFGAIAGDGLPDTAAIQAAVAACEGVGGTVVIPQGEWSTGTVRLGSNMTLLLEQEAVLALHPDIDLFPEMPVSRDNGSAMVRAALLADGVEALRIEGAGRIEGNGEAFWDDSFYESGLRRPTLPRPGPVIELANCSDTHVSGISMTNMPAYAIRYHRCDGVSATGITIRNDPRSPNTDGIQLRDTSNAVIRGVDIRTGDDAIVLKSGDRIVDNILVENSYLESDDAALKFGTGSREGVTNSVFRNIEIRNSRYGIALFMIDGGTHANNLFENIVISTGGRNSRQFPIFLDIDRREADRSLGRIVDTTFRNLAIETSGASLIAGNPDAPIEGLILRNIVLTIRDPFDVTVRSAKPRGNINIEGQSGSVDYSTANAHFAFGHIDGLSLGAINIAVGDDGGHDDGGRQDFFLQDVTLTLQN
ncbi:glycosyl hydrolase family 28 protein [Erythrobacter sp. SN021]|uniref:glycoside hydrolase family 28 protein n=1 Tax=Erythrobacter sp. SN021 TaxID=2912574 RepID=UPI001F024FAD|nr:glycosyl hydrolase family 28 protein [Erythrobacter sp. SN021]MCF8882707.1 glycosyl hydrolase family 28 protein [Erythrobacter sp. SN021]